MKARFALLIALLAFGSPNAIHSEDGRANKIAPIRRLPGHSELKKQADAERRAVESGALAPEIFPTPTPRTPEIGATNFAGMDFGDSDPDNPNPDAGSVPPDTHAAVGPNHIVEVVNSAIAIYDRTTGAIATGYPKSLDVFFTVNISGCIFDPVVAYDEIAGRFYVGALDVPDVCPNSAQHNTAKLLYAVSNSSDPTAGFTEQHAIDVNEPKNSACSVSQTVGGDFTRTGWNADAHVFTFNMFGFTNGCFDHVAVIVIDKSTVLDENNGTFGFNHVDRSGADNFTLTPAVMHGSSPGDPMWFAESVFFNQIRIVKMSGTPNILTSPTFDNNDISVATYGLPPNATQSGGGFTLDTGDTRVLNAEWRGDRLVTAHTVGLSGIARARWYEFNTSGTPTLAQQGTIAPSSAHTYYPSIAIGPNGDIGMTFMQSSTKQFISMYVTGQSFGDAPGTMQTPFLVKAGQQNYTAFDCTTKDGCRAGDYSGITVDPDSSGTDIFCAANEYATNFRTSENWGTWISCFTLVPNHDLAVTKLTAPKSLAGTGDVVGFVKVTIQNRSDHNETVTDASMLGNLVELDVEVGNINNEGCIDAVWQLDPVATAALFSKTPTVIIKPKGSLTVTFRVTYNCSGAKPKGADPDTSDYTHTAKVHHDALAGGLADTHPADDVCPRPPLGFDVNPPPKGTTDKGCGAKTPLGVLGGPVVTDIVF